MNKDLQTPEAPKRKEESIIDAQAERIRKLEKINEEMLNIILEQSRHIRYMEEMEKVRRI